MERLVRKSVPKRNVDGIAKSIPNTTILELASSREVGAVLVKAARHDSVRTVEGLLDAIAVVAVNIDVEHTGENAE